MSASLFNPEDSLAKATLDRCRKEAKAVHFTYSGGVIAKGQNIPFFQIVNVDIHRDFVNNFADEITITVMLDTRKYYSTVVNNLDNLEVYIRRKQMAENSLLFVMGGKNEHRKYKAILHNPPVQGLAGDANGGNNQITNPDQQLTMCTFQLIVPAAIQLKLTKWHGMMEMTQPLEALKIILSATSDGQEMERGLTIKGVHATPPDNTEPRLDIIVPVGTLVKDCSQYIQQQYGIYNFGIGSYLFDENWFVYPLFNCKRYQNEHFKLAITVIGKRYDIMSVPRTYYVNDGMVVICTTEATSVAKNAISDQINYGTGVQVINRIENQTEVHERKDNDVKMVGQQVSTLSTIPRNDGYNNIITSYKPNNNMMDVMSSVAGNNGTYITVSWLHANPDLLQPGMPVKLVYVEDGRKEIYGTLHEYHAIMKRTGKQIFDSPYSCTVTMVIYVELQ